MRNGFLQDSAYWDEKLAAYLHDPPDKALRIPGHEERSRRLLDILGPLPQPDPGLIRMADQTAAGMDRTQLPGHSARADLNGSIDFLGRPLLTHPTAREAVLPLQLDMTREDCASVARAIEALIEADIERVCDSFPGRPELLSPARFHYVHHALRERLRRENIGGLGGLWGRLPADTRIPDHSIWQHCGLAAAIYSCFKRSKTCQAALLVVSLAPVQGFIERARKLRDLWVGSVLLSWLAFEGIREVIYRLGSDHVLYPSLIGQGLVEDMLRRECGLEGLLAGDDGVPKAEGASLPNKFVCLVPAGEEEETAAAIEARVREAWEDLGRMTLDRIETVIGGKKDPYLIEQFHRQMKGYWTFRWSACPLLDEGWELQIKGLLPPSVWEKPFNLVADSKEHALPYPLSGQAAFYSVSHAMAQSFLAAGKYVYCEGGALEKDAESRLPVEKNGRPDGSTEREEGIKCGLHGDLEALRFEWRPGEDRNPRPSVDPFWSLLKQDRDLRPEFRSSERLCAVATVKRLAGRVIKGSKTDHPLKPLFEKADVFPSTTELAFGDWLNEVAGKEPQGVKALEPYGSWRKVLAQFIHDTDEPDAPAGKGEHRRVLEPEARRTCREFLHAMEKRGRLWTDADRYYAILLMDGDRMGRLVGGEILPARWESTIHPDLTERLRTPSFDAAYRGFWKEHLGETRVVTPGVHAALSEALGDFSLHTVPEIIRRCRGRLIYAGGDDVCAVMPVSTALSAAHEIARMYATPYVVYDAVTGTAQPIVGPWVPERLRLAYHLGEDRCLSISGAVLICHHKRPLADAMAAARRLLEGGAKEEGGRNAVAVELAKRSGGPRAMVMKWNARPHEALLAEIPKEIAPDDTLVDHFLDFSRAFGARTRLCMSSSLMYRVEEMRDGLDALAARNPADLPKFLKTLIVRSDPSLKPGKGEARNPRLERIAWQAAALLLGPDAAVRPEALLIARFLGPQLFRYQGTGEGGCHV